MKYKCVCCGKRTMTEKPPGTREVCPICKWEDDASQYRDKDYKSGANSLSLHEARIKFKGKQKKA